MTDETPKVEPCAWCGKDARQSAHYAWCDNKDCPESQLPGTNFISSWNDRQRRILAARRKDFDAGVNSVDKHGECMGTFDDYLRGGE